MPINAIFYLVPHGFTLGSDDVQFLIGRRGN